MKEKINNKKNDEKWEYFLDHSYYDMWCVRRKTERNFGQGFHVSDGAEAEALCDILNKYKVV